jgi:hypothetical protein
MWGVGASLLAWWQAHQRKQETHNTVAFLLGIKAAASQPMITQINDQIARLERRK